jgi:hypothetical protein
MCYPPFISRYKQQYIHITFIHRDSGGGGGGGGGIIICITNITPLFEFRLHFLLMARRADWAMATRLVVVVEEEEEGVAVLLLMRMRMVLVIGLLSM